MKKNLVQSKGMTLVELIVALAVFLIVITMAFSFFFFSQTSVTNGVAQQDIQSRLRIASDFIANQSRYASDVEIVTETVSDLIANQASIPVYTSYLIYDDVSGDIMMINNSEIKSTSLGVGSTLTFGTDLSNDNMISFDLLGVSKGQDYTINSEIICLNIHNGVSKKVLGSSGNALKLTTEDDYISKTALPIAEIQSNSKTSVTISFNKSFANLIITTTDTQATISSSISGNELTYTFSPENKVKQNDYFVFTVEFTIGSDVYTYAYRMSYANNGDWTIE